MVFILAKLFKQLSSTPLTSFAYKILFKPGEKLLFILILESLTRQRPTLCFFVFVYIVKPRLACHFARTLIFIWNFLIWFLACELCRTFLSFTSDTTSCSYCKAYLFAPFSILRSCFLSSFPWLRRCIHLFLLYSVTVSVSFTAALRSSYKTKRNYSVLPARLVSRKNELSFSALAPAKIYSRMQSPVFWTWCRSIQSAAYSTFLSPVVESPLRSLFSGLMTLLTLSFLVRVLAFHVVIKSWLYYTYFPTTLELHF